MRPAGRSVAEALAGSWRETPPETGLSAAELAAVTPLLLASGGGALVWRKVSQSILKGAPAAAELRQAYRLHALQSSLHERNIRAIFRLLRRAGVRPVLVKGWAVARLYPEPGARPYGDIDLCVRPEDYGTARAALAAAGDKYPVDLHSGLQLLDRRGFDEVFSRSHLVPLGRTLVRVPCHEDHLRILCFHALRHGVERPIGLCDIAVAVESRPPDFDWGLCLGGDARRADWIACTAGLAHRLLDARTEDTPLAGRADTLPRWLVRAVLERWRIPFSEHFTLQDPMSFSLRRPRGLARSLARRWPNPIVGTYSLGGSFNALPRFPYQFAYLLKRTRDFIKARPADGH